MATIKEEIIKIQAPWNIPFTHTAGKHASKLFIAMRDKKQLLATKCEKCKRVIFPPRPFCERCFVPLSSWVEVKDRGILISFTISYMKYTGLPDPPYSVGLIRLDGTDTPFVHTIGGINLSDYKKATQKL